MHLRSLATEKQWKGKRVLVRVDFNVPLEETVDQESFLKITRSLETIRWLLNKGAVVILLTHLGRPKGAEAAFSTQRLLPILKTHKLNPIFHPEEIIKKTECARLQKELTEAKESSLHLLENVRFNPGEEENDRTLAKIYASFGDCFVNEAFAVCHRKQASVVALAKLLPSYAGLALQEEVRWLEKILAKPKSPFFVFLGGKKISTKIPLIRALLPLCDRIYLGSAMAATCLAAQGVEMGESFVEKEQFRVAKTLLKQKQVHLPLDFIVSRSATIATEKRCVAPDAIQPIEIVVDVGLKTLKQWADEIKTAKTILWNGPVGITEVDAFAAGSRGLARFIGKHAKGSATGVAGGGDTLPVIFSARVEEEFDYLSTGGGAMIEFLAKAGRLPGLDVLH